MTDEEEEDQGGPARMLARACGPGSAGLGASGELKIRNTRTRRMILEDGKRHGPAAAARCHLLLLGQIRAAQRDEVRQNGDDVNDVHDVFEEEGLAGTSKAANHN